MFMDKTTEAIAYFIGLFQTVTENTHSRIEYSSFRFQQKKQMLDLLQEHSAARDFVYGPQGYAPQAQDATPYSLPAPTPAPQAPQPLPQTSLAPPDVHLPSGALAPPLEQASAAGPSGALPPVHAAPPPGASVHVTLQVNTLVDQDNLNISAETAQGFVQTQSENLMELQVLAARLQVLDPEAVTLATDQFSSQSDDLAEENDLPSPAEVGETIITQILDRADDAAAQTPAATVHIATGTSLQGVTVNGEAEPELPAWQDALPQPLQPDAETETDETPQAADTPTQTTGENLALNEAIISGGGVDAAVIAVGGDVASLDVISQVNVLRDDAARPEEDNQLINAASFDGQPTETAPPGTGGAGSLPGPVTLACVEDDLITYDWIHQINMIRDEDTVSFTTSGSETTLSTGENQAINFNFTGTFGQAYDLILVAGDMISQNIISQTNILLDEDFWLSHPAPTPASQPAAASQSSDNALINSASITHTGEDQISALTGDFRALLDGFDPEAPDLSPVLTSGLWAPQEVLSVLYVGGDLIQMREVTQINVLSDSDLIDIPNAPDGPEPPEAPSDAAMVSTGANATVNLATIFDNGLPSHVMSGGSVFSDAVLYQAQLISGDAPPTDVRLAPGPEAPLASEAVAFLTDLNATGNAADADHTAASTAVQDDAPAHLDVMQTMLA